MSDNLNKRRITISVQGFIDPLLKDYRNRILFILDNFSEIIDGIEIGFFLDQIKDISKAFIDEKVLNALEQFTYNTIHVANRSSTILLNEIEEVMQYATKLFESKTINHISYHLDLFEKFDYIQFLNDINIPLFWENLGNTAVFGNRFQDMLNAVQMYPEWLVTFDIAHAMEMALKGEPEIEKYIEEFHFIIDQIHFSWPENLYSKIILDKNFDTAHSLVHLKKNKYQNFFDIIKKIKPKVITIEGVIPPGEIGIQLVHNEIIGINRDF